MKKQIVGIIGGHGKMGRFFTKFFEKNNFEVRISDRDTKFSNTDVAKVADIVMIAVPMDVICDVIREVGPHVRKESLLMDINSIKGPVVDDMLTYCKGSVLGCHPMFAPSNTLMGQVCILCKGRGQKWQTKISRLFEGNGAEVKILDAKQHDTFMTLIQGLMHFVDITAAKTLSDIGIPVEKLFAFRSPSYRLKLDLMGRTLYQDANLYGNIQIQNRENLRVLKQFLRNSEELFSSIERKSLKEFKDFWGTAKKYLGDFAEICQKESDEIIDFLSISYGSEERKLSHHMQTGNLGVLGPENTFSHLAAKKIFPKESSLVLLRSLPEVFTAFNQKKVTSILVPIENKLHGSVRETLDSLFECTQPISAVFRMPIHFVLAGLPTSTLGTIDTVLSHTQPLAQCSEFLQTSLPETVPLPVSSTAIAIQEILKKRDAHKAVICSEEAAKNAGLKILATDLTKSNGNETLFAFLSHSPENISFPKGVIRSSVVFYFDQDSPGSLASVLQNFSEAKVNLTKIESRPTAHQFGDYLFFLDFEGSIFSKTVREVLLKTEKKVAKLKVLGSYPVISLK